jgi:hypothetical protein
MCLQVQESWKLIERELEAAGIMLFMRVFDIAPELLRLFSFRGSVSLLAHTIYVHKYIRTYIDRPDLLRLFSF